MRKKKKKLSVSARELEEIEELAKYYVETFPSLPLKKQIEIMKETWEESIEAGLSLFSIWTKRQVSSAMAEEIAMIAGRIWTFDEILVEKGLLPNLDEYNRRIKQNIKKAELQIRKSEKETGEYPKILLPAGGEGEA